MTASRPPPPSSVPPSSAPLPTASAAVAEPAVPGALDRDDVVALAAGCGLLLQYVPAQAAMLTLAGLLAAAVAYSATRRELWHARWPAR
jgi:hypothetical protein